MGRMILAIGAVALAGTVAACTSSIAGHGATAAAPPPGNAFTVSAPPGETSSVAASPGDGTPVTEPPGNGGTLDGARLVQMTTTAAENAQTVKIRETTKFLGEPMTGGGALRFAGASIDAIFVVHAKGMQLQMIMTGGDVYIKDLNAPKSGKPWVKSAPSDAADMTALLQQSDPRRTVKMLAGAGRMTPVAQETVNGIRAAHYAVRVDMAKVAKQAPELADEANAALNAGVRTEDVQVWIGPDKLPVRMITSFTASGPNGKPVASRQTVDYAGWGDPVQISAPPADQVAER